MKKYFDFCAFTPPEKETVKLVNEIHKKQSKGILSNPNSSHKSGQDARKIIDESKEIFKDFFGVKGSNIVFTSTATEANHLAIRSAIDYGKEVRNIDNPHIIIGANEHDSIIRVLEYHKRNGVTVDYISSDERGNILLDELKKRVKKNTVLISIHHANGNYGTLQNLKRIGDIRDSFDKKILFHSDISQTIQNYNYKLNNIDMVSFDSYKYGGVQGVGGFIYKEGIDIQGVSGLKTSWDIRQGTQATALIAGMSFAFKEVLKDRKEKIKKLRNMQKSLIEELKSIPGTEVKSFEKGVGEIKEKDLDKIVPNMLFISFPNTDHEYLTFLLDSEGFSVTNKTACSIEEGIKKETIDLDGIRVSFNHKKRKKDMINLVNAIRKNLDLAKKS